MFLFTELANPDLLLEEFNKCRSVVCTLENIVKLILMATNWANICCNQLCYINPWVIPDRHCISPELHRLVLVKENLYHLACWDQQSMELVSRPDWWNILLILNPLTSASNCLYILYHTIVLNTVNVRVFFFPSRQVLTAILVVSGWCIKLI